MWMRFLKKLKKIIGWHAPVNPLFFLWNKKNVIYGADFAFGKLAMFNEIQWYRVASGKICGIRIVSKFSLKQVAMKI